MSKEDCPGGALLSPKEEPRLEKLTQKFSTAVIMNKARAAAAAGAAPYAQQAPSGAVPELLLAPQVGGVPPTPTQVIPVVTGESSAPQASKPAPGAALPGTPAQPAAAPSATQGGTSSGLVLTGGEKSLKRTGSPVGGGGGAGEDDGGNSKTNLIINYLPQTMTPEEMKRLFGEYGEIETCKLVRDKQSGQSLGFGFVNYKRQEDAERAIENLNQLRIQNKTIKVSHARPSSDNIKGANLYICGLPKSFTQRDLECLFQPCGQIITSRILNDNRSGMSKGVGFVRYDKRCEAERAIERLNGHVPEGAGEKITVKFANNPSSKAAAAIPYQLTASCLAPAAGARQFIGPMHHATGRYSSLYRFSPFEAPGLLPAAMPTMSSMAALTLPTNTLTAAAALQAGAATLAPAPTPPTLPAGALPGAAALQMGGAHTALAPSAAGLGAAGALAGVGALGMPGSAAAAGLAGTAGAFGMTASAPSLDPAGWCLFVYNLPPEATDATLWEAFGPYGAVLSVKVVRDLATQKCKGYGFVTMCNYQDAFTALNRLNGSVMGDRQLQVSFKQPTRKF